MARRGSAVDLEEPQDGNGGRRVLTSRELMDHKKYPPLGSNGVKVTAASTRPAQAWRAPAPLWPGAVQVRPPSASGARVQIDESAVRPGSAGGIRTGGPGQTPKVAVPSARHVLRSQSTMSQFPTPQPQKKKRAPHTGHVFILRCHVRGIAADTLLIPPRKPETFDSYEVRQMSDEEVSETFGEGCLVRGVFEGRIQTTSYHDEETAIEGNSKVVENYIASAGPMLKGTRSRFRRAMPLMAMPMPGCGEMDEPDIIVNEGQMIRTVLPMLYACAEKFQIDVAVCTGDPNAYAVAVIQRSQMCPMQGGAFWMLSAEHRKEAQRLRESAISGQLALLYGAGVSIASGLPNWGELLNSLAEQAGFDDEDREALKQLMYLDQPKLIAEKMGGHQPFKEAVAKLVRKGRYTPAHAMLGAIGDTQKVPAATTNYDLMFEEAVESAKGKVLRIPWQLQEARSDHNNDFPQLLKLHGCAKDPESIVLMREDYMRYADERGVLRGLLSEMLMQRELLVVGFSMTDENVHKAIDEVRKVQNYEAQQRGEEHQHLGTCLTLVENAMFRNLWKEDFQIISCSDDWNSEHAPEWICDCFLDCLVSGITESAAANSFIMNSKYQVLLTRPQLTVKSALEPLHYLAGDAEVRNSPMWPVIENLLREFGWTPQENDNDKRFARRSQTSAKLIL